MASLGDFFINFVAKTDDIDNALKQTEKKLALFSSSFSKNVLGSAIGVLTAQGIASITSGREKVTAVADEIAKTARQLNVAIEDLFAFGEAAARMGSSAKSLRQSLVNLSKRLTTVQIGDRGAAPIKKVFEELNIEVFEANGEFRNLVDIFTDLNRAVQKFGSEKSLGYLSRLGIDEKTSRLLQLAPEQFDALIARQKMLGTYSFDAAERVEKFNDLLSDFNQVLSVLTVELGTKLLPVLNKVLEWVVTVTSRIGSKEGSVDWKVPVTPQAREKTQVEREQKRTEQLQEYEKQLGVTYPDPEEIRAARERDWQEIQEKTKKTVNSFFDYLQNGLESFFRGVPASEKKLSYSGPGTIRSGGTVNNSLTVKELNIHVAQGDPGTIEKSIEENLEGAWKRLASRSLSGLKS